MPREVSPEVSSFSPRSTSERASRTRDVKRTSASARCAARSGNGKVPLTAVVFFAADPPCLFENFPNSMEIRVGRALPCGESPDISPRHGDSLEGHTRDLYCLARGNKERRAEVS